MSARSGSTAPALVHDTESLVFDSNNTCALHGRHAGVEPLEGDWHHIWPRGMGGPDIWSNKRLVCPTGHRNVHHILRMIIENPGDPRVQTDTTRKQGAVGTLSERELAWSGYRQWDAAKRPGNPELIDAPR